MCCMKRSLVFRWETERWHLRATSEGAYLWMYCNVAIGCITFRHLHKTTTNYTQQKGEPLWKRQFLSSFMLKLAWLCARIQWTFDLSVGWRGQLAKIEPVTIAEMFACRNRQFTFRNSIIKDSMYNGELETLLIPGKLYSKASSSF